MSTKAVTKGPQILSVRTAAQSRLFRIEAVQLRFANGAEREFERLAADSGAGTVIVVPMLDPATFVLVREYAVGLERYELGLPMGRIEPGESLAAAANRELMEEIGFGARRLERLHTLSLAPGILGYRAEVVLATDLYPMRLRGDEPEPVEVVFWPASRLDRVIAEAELTEARTLAALFLARDLVARRSAACS